jgi:hypothetical protein
VSGLCFVLFYALVAQKVSEQDSQSQSQEFGGAEEKLLMKGLLDLQIHVV